MQTFHELVNKTSILQTIFLKLSVYKEGNLPRGARVVAAGLVYHVTARGNNRGWLFQDEVDFLKYFDLCRRYKESFGLSIFHWVFMNSHIPLLLHAKDGTSLAKSMQGLTPVAPSVFAHLPGNLVR